MGLLAGELEQMMRKKYVQPAWIARLYAHAGNKERALYWLENAFEQRDLLMTNLNTSTDWVILHDDPQYQDMLRRMKFPKTD